MESAWCVERCGAWAGIPHHAESGRQGGAHRVSANALIEGHDFVGAESGTGARGTETAEILETWRFERLVMLNADLATDSDQKSLYRSRQGRSNLCPSTVTSE